MNIMKQWIKECGEEFRGSLWKRPIGSRIRWAIASLFTLGLAYYAHLSYLDIGGGTPENPWANPTGQLFLAMRDVGVLAGLLGLLIMSILGLGDTPEEKREQEALVGKGEDETNTH